MPWWSEGCEETRKMVISYDNLIRRLWLHGAIIPYSQSDHMDTLLNEEGMPPIPHDFWVHRLGFQQNDPVTDFRSGGVLSLAMMVFMVESSPQILRRFIRPDGDASVLPFGITSINITDMISKFLMLAKSVDRMDALLSQKPFWLMFADPNALLACQELSMDMLADVVVELQTERSLRDDSAKVTVFDFSAILERTERRVQYDLLGAGPKTVDELRAVHAKLKAKYQTQLQQRLQTYQADRGAETIPGKGTMTPSTATPQVPAAAADVRDQVLHRASGLAAGATSLAGSFVSRMNVPTAGNMLSGLRRSTGSVVAASASDTPNTQVSQAVATAPIASAETTKVIQMESGAPAATTAAVDDDDMEGDWVRTDITAATDGVSHFSISDEDDEHL